MHARTQVLSSLPLLRHAASAAVDVAASHRALNAPVLPIEGAWTCAHAINTRALAVFLRVSARPSCHGTGRRSTRRLDICISAACDNRDMDRGSCIKFFGARVTSCRRFALHESAEKNAAKNQVHSPWVRVPAPSSQSQFFHPQFCMNEHPQRRKMDGNEERDAFVISPPLTGWVRIPHSAE